MNTKRGSLVIAGIFSAFLLYCYFKCTGLYLEGYESFFNFLSYDLSSYVNHPIPKVYDLNFLVSTLLVALQRIFTGLNFFVLYKLLTLFLILFSIFLSFEKMKNKILRWIVPVILICLLSDSIIFIHSNKLVMLLPLFAFFAVRSSAKSTWAHAFFYLCILVSITIRVDLALISISVVLLSTVIDGNNRWKKHLIIAFILALSSNVALRSMIFFDVDGLKNFYTYERAIADQMDFSINDNPGNPSLSEEQLQIFAAGYFIEDAAAETQNVYDKITKHSSRLDYIFQNPQFKSIYLEKLKSSYSQLLEYHKTNIFLFLIGSILLFLMNGVVGSSRKQVSFLIASMLFWLLFINIFALLSTDFLSVFILYPFFVFILLASLTMHQNLSHILTLLVLVSAIANCSLGIAPKLQQMQLEEKEHEAIFQSIEKDVKHGKSPFFAYIEYQYIFPKKLNFKLSAYPYTFIDYGPFNSFAHFQKKQIADFGPNAKDFDIRMKACVSNDHFIYGAEETLRFYINYLEKIHQISVKTEEIDSYFNGEFKKYQLR